MVFACSAIILEGKKILLIRRSNYTATFPLHWACPGGRAEEEESPEEAVVREVREETSLEFSPTELFAKGTYGERELFRFLGTWKGEVTVQAEEIAGWGWFTYEKARKLELGFDYADIIEKLRSRKLI